MDVKFDSLTFHQLNNQITMVLAYMEMLDRKMEPLGAGDPALLDHWNELKKSCAATPLHCSRNIGTVIDRAIIRPPAYS